MKMCVKFKVKISKGIKSDGAERIIGFLSIHSEEVTWLFLVPRINNNHYLMVLQLFCTIKY